MSAPYSDSTTPTNSGAAVAASRRLEVISLRLGITKSRAGVEILNCSNF